MMKTFRQALSIVFSLFLTCWYFYMASWSDREKLIWSDRFDRFFGLEMNLPYQGYMGLKGFYLYDEDLYWLTPLIGLITVILLATVLSKTVKPFSPSLRAKNRPFAYLGLLPCLYFPMKALMFFSVRSDFIKSLVASYFPSYSWVLTLIYKGNGLMFFMSVLGQVFYRALKKEIN